MKEELRMMDIDKIEPNPFQPRETFEHEPLRELADSINEMGVLQPILVRPHRNKYQIIAGERRWRACLEAGRKEMPVLIRDLNDSELQIASLIENVHREDLQPIEKGKAFLELGKTKGFFEKDGMPKMENAKIYAELAEKTKKTTDYVRRHLNLLDLPDYIQKEIVSTGRRPAEGRITEHHARALARIKEPETQKEVFEKIRKERLTGTEAEKLAGIVEKAPEPIKKAVLRDKITSDTAEKIMEKVEIAEDVGKVDVGEFTKATIEEAVEVEKESKKEMERMLRFGEEIAKGEKVAKDFPKERISTQKKTLAGIAQIVENAWWAFDVTIIDSMGERMRNEAIRQLQKLENLCHERLTALGVYEPTGIVEV